FSLLLLSGCKKEVNDDVAFAQTGNAPDQLNALFEITQDNTGMVTITPNGAGAVSYDVYFGDNTQGFVKIAAGKNVTHKYAEGVYNVKLVGRSINGKTAEATKQLTVAFRAPENLEFTVTVDPANSMKISVTAKALYETNFRVYFGDVPNEVPVSFMEGDVLTHTYAAVGTYQVKVVALSGGAATTELTKPITIVNPVLLPVTFESPTVNYAFSNFGGGNVTVINNPQANGLNTSSRVARMVKSADQVYGGSLISLGTPIDFSANKVFRMKVFSPRVGAKVLLKVENLTNGGIAFEKEVSTTVANAWEDLAFDYTAINTANSYQKLVLIFDNGTMGDGSANFTFLFDDIRLTNVLPSSLLTLPVTFDNPNVIYSTTDFGGNVTVDAVDPILATNKVKRTTKPNGAQTWAGTTLGQLATALPFTATATQMSVRVYSPAAGLPVLLKVEDRANNTRSVETIAVTTVANAWETLVFNFANNAAGTSALNLSYTYNMVNIFFDFNTAGNGKIFYWDDVTFVAPAPATLSLPLTFESTTLNYAFVNFEGGVATVISNPQVNGINTSGRVGRMVKNAGQTYGGSVIALDNPINFSTQKIVRMKVFSPRVGAKVLLKVENLTNGGISFEKEVTTTVANAWEDLTFDYSAINTANSYQKVVLIFDNGIMGDGSPNFTFLFDDIRLN
ncbi:MAG TPA: PKD domain-containing protein, partial [Flavisolibacter sp.]|nr:PKD domain-containing protein [Flavisolibacter sp.]